MNFEEIKRIIANDSLLSNPKTMLVEFSMIAITSALVFLNLPEWMQSMFVFVLQVFASLSIFMTIVLLAGTLMLVANGAETQKFKISTLNFQKSQGMMIVTNICLISLVYAANHYIIGAIFIVCAVVNRLSIIMLRNTAKDLMMKKLTTLL